MPMYPTDSNTNPFRERLKRALWGFGLALLILIAWASMNTADGQVVETARETVSEHVEFGTRGSMAVWPRAKRSYMHAYEAGARATITWGPVRARGYLTGRFWQTDDSKVPKSPVNAENNMNQQILYGGSLELTHNGFFVGPAIHRTEIHVVWRHKLRNGYVMGYTTPSNDWKGQETKCRAGNGCPSIAYQDAAGGIVGYDHPRFSAQVKYLPVRWKDLTLVPVPLRARAILRAPSEWPVIQGDWEAQVNVQKDILNRWRGDIRLRRNVIGRLWATVRAGRFQPDHKPSFTRLAAGLLIR